MGFKHGELNPQFKHGDGRRGKKTPEYYAWYNMRQRCSRSGHKTYSDRGITVCKRWQGKDGFTNFLADMGRRPSPKHTLERKINDFPYSPRNCVWATMTQQNRNRSNNKLTPAMVAGIRFLRLFGFTYETIGKKFGVSQSLVGRIIIGQQWR
jgi:hypothetical protein